MLIISLPGFAQEEADGQDGNDRIRDRMNEYIQKRLNLSKDEARRFTPVFIRYFKDWRTTIRENRGDRLLLQRKVVDLRLKYRPEFKEILGERRGNLVYDHQEIFIREMRKLGQERMQNRRLRNDRSPVILDQ